MRDHFDPLVTCRLYERGVVVGATMTAPSPSPSPSTTPPPVQHGTTCAGMPAPAARRDGPSSPGVPRPVKFVQTAVVVTAASTDGFAPQPFGDPRRPLHQSYDRGGASFSLPSNQGQMPTDGGGTGLKRRAETVPGGPGRVDDDENDDGGSRGGACLLDCQALQSSLKRVRLSCSPGELRLQRDLKLLPPPDWQPVHGEADGWTHLPTQARLTLVDSLRMCLFMPATATPTPATMFSRPRPLSERGSHPFPPPSSASAYASSCASSYSPASSFSHKWRIMIQIPRMYPHRPPVVSRTDGLWMEQIVVNDAPPARSSWSSPGYDDGHDGDDGGMGRPSVTPPLLSAAATGMSDDEGGDAHGCSNGVSSFAGHVRHHHHRGRQYQVCGEGRTVVWNHWSPIVSLGDLLDFLLSVVATATGPGTCPTAAATHATDDEDEDDNGRVGIHHDGMMPQPWSLITSSTLSSSSSSAASTVVSSMLGSGHFREEHKTEDGTDHVTARNADPATLLHGGNNPQPDLEERFGTTRPCEGFRTHPGAALFGAEAGHVDSDAADAAPSSFFLTPNRFDVGYEKPNVNGYGQHPTATNQDPQDDAMMME